MMLSILLFSLMDATVKWLGAIYPTAQIMFFRCAVALVPVAVIIAMRGGPGILRTGHKGLHLLRSVMAQYLMTLSYQHLAVGILAPLKYLTVVFSGCIAYLVWDEIPDPKSVIGIGIIVGSGLYTLHRELIRGEHAGR